MAASAVSTVLVSSAMVDAAPLAAICMSQNGVALATTAVLMANCVLAAIIPLGNRPTIATSPLAARKTNSRDKPPSASTTSNPPAALAVKPVAAVCAVQASSCLQSATAVSLPAACAGYQNQPTPWPCLRSIQQASKPQTAPQAFNNCRNTNGRMPPWCM